MDSSPLQRALLCSLLENGKLGNSMRMSGVRPGSDGSRALALGSWGPQSWLPRDAEKLATNRLPVGRTLLL